MFSCSSYTIASIPAISVKFIKLDPEAIPFTYTRDGDACMDMYALEDVTIDPHKSKIVNTGIALEIPEGFEGIIRGRSGLASKGIIIHTGTIESTYRGDVGIIVYNSTFKPFEIKKGMRIAQFTIKPVIYINLQETTELTTTERGVNGYGSSGI